MANEGSTKPTYEELERSVRELDASVDQLIGERDAAQDALQEAHIALGGDGEWVAKFYATCPPDTGDLKLDVPELAAQLKSELARVRGLLQRSWISVEERLPSQDTNVLVACYSMNGKWTQVAFLSGERWIGVDGGVRVKFWQPIPVPPTFPQSSSLVSQGAESADIGKLDSADKSAKVVCSFCGSLDWTIEKFGRITHKQACPHRTDKFSQAGSAETGGEKA